MRDSIRIVLLIIINYIFADIFRRSITYLPRLSMLSDDASVIIMHTCETRISGLM